MAAHDPDGEEAEKRENKKWFRPHFILTLLVIGIIAPVAHFCQIAEDKRV